MIREPWEEVLAGQAPAAPARVPGAPVATIQVRAGDPNAAPKSAAELRHVQLVNAKLEREAKDAAAANEPITAATGLTGADYLKTLPPAIASVVQAVDDGRVKLPVSTRKDPYWRQILQHVVTMDPNFDQTDFGARQKARTDLGPGGKIGQRLNAFGTAIQHAANLQDAIGALHNRSGFFGRNVANPIGNTMSALEGDPAVTNFRNIRHKYSEEGAKILLQSGSGTGGERQETENLLGLNDSPEQQIGVLRGDARLYLEAIRQLDFSIKQQLGPNAKVQDFLSPEALDAYRKLMGPGGAFREEAAAHGDPLGIVGPGLSGGGAPPHLGGGSQGPVPGGPPRIGGGDSGLQRIFNQSGNRLDRSVATGSNRNVYNPQVSAQADAMIRAGRPPSEINAFFAANGADRVPEAAILAAQRYHQQHPEYHNSFVEATKSVPVSTWEQISGSAPAAASVGATNALTGGLVDEAAGGASALLGGDYTATRDEVNARKHALADTHPIANLAGNVAGGIAATLGGDALLGRVAPGLAGMIAKAPAALGDAAYGVAYGAGENNEDRLSGALLGGATAAGAGMAARGTVRGLSSMIAPTGGDMAPLYAEGVFPTIGQRLGSKGFPGRAINTFEQALQSIPLAGSLVSRARNIPREQFQLGAFNNSLREIGDQLPDGMQPGNDPHVYASQAFNKAYDAARSGMQFAPDQPYLADLRSFQGKLSDATLDAVRAKQVADRIQNAVGSRLKAGNGVLSGDAYKAAASDLADTARAWSKEDPLKAAALNDYITIFDNAARRNSHPEAVAALDAADRGYAKLVRIQDASAARGGDSGEFSPTQFDRSVQRNSGGVRSSAYNQGDALMQDYATAGKNLVDTLPNSGTSERLFTGQAVTGVGGGGAMALGVPLGMLAKPGALALSPYLPGLNALTTRAIAPRINVLSPNLAASLDALGAKVNDRAPIAGRLAVPTALGWEMNQ